MVGLKCHMMYQKLSNSSQLVCILLNVNSGHSPGGVLPYITYIGMCRCEGYGFQAVWSGIGYRNQGVLV